MLFPFTPDPDALTDSEHQQARWHPEQETLELAAASAATVLGPHHGTTKAFARAAETGDRVDLWRARLALKTLTRERRQAIAAAAG